MKIKNYDELISITPDRSQVKARKILIDLYKTAVNAVNPQNIIQNHLEYKAKDKLLKIDNDQYSVEISRFRFRATVESDSASTKYVDIIVPSVFLAPESQYSFLVPIVVQKPGFKNIIGEWKVNAWYEIFQYSWYNKKGDAGHFPILTKGDFEPKPMDTVGAGAYANNQCGAVSATGWGESIMKVLLSKTACDFLRDNSATNAAKKAIDVLDKRVNGWGGVILIDKHGNYGFAHNTTKMVFAYAHPSGEIVAKKMI